MRLGKLLKTKKLHFNKDKCGERSRDKNGGRLSQQSIWQAVPPKAVVLGINSSK